MQQSEERAKIKADHYSSTQQEEASKSAGVDDRVLEIAQGEVMAAQAAAEERHKGDAYAAEQKKKGDQASEEKAKGDTSAVEQQAKGDAKAAEQKKKVAATEQDSKASLQ